MTQYTYEVISEGGLPIKAWVRGVQLEEAARAQLLNLAKLPFIYRHVAVMPDAHMGKGACVGSVIPTLGAIIPAAVGVDIGCGMSAVRTSLSANQLPDSLAPLRAAIEKAVPHGSPVRGQRDDGSWHDLPQPHQQTWSQLQAEYRLITDKHPKAAHRRPEHQLGTLGGGNHFIEVCLDEEDRVWFMLHSGSRGAGNRIGTYFIELARRDMERQLINLPDRDLAYLPEGTEHFDDYCQAVAWAQTYARINRDLMMAAVAQAAQKLLPAFTLTMEAVNCHHNYIQKENHYGQTVWVTRKGAVSAREGELGIIPGSMGAQSFIVRGKGNPESFTSCSHGAGRVMSRTQAKKTFTLEEHIQATQGVECRKDAAVIDETPGAYKDIHAVMQAQNDLVEVVHTLKQVLCVKG